MMAEETLDLFELHRDEYNASAEPRLVDVEPALFLTIDGMGEPGGEQFTRRLEALYKVAYQLKNHFKKDARDYRISKLEALWWGVRGPGDFSSEPKSDWNWKLMIRIPDFVEPDALKEVAELLQQSGRIPEVAKVHLEKIEEGRCVQALHTGSYDLESETIQRMNEFVRDHGLSFHGLHHEIYLSDPRRTPEDRLKTILRMPVC